MLEVIVDYREYKHCFSRGYSICFIDFGIVLSSTQRSRREHAGGAVSRMANGTANGRVHGEPFFGSKCLRPRFAAEDNMFP